MRMFVALVEIGRPVLIISTTEVYSKTYSPKVLMYLQDDPTIGCRKSENRVFRDQVEPFQGIALRFKLVLLIGGVMLPSSNWNLFFSPRRGEEVSLGGLKFYTKDSANLQKSYHPLNILLFFHAQGGVCSYALDDQVWTGHSVQLMQEVEKLRPCNFRLVYLS